MLFISSLYIHRYIIKIIYDSFDHLWGRKVFYRRVLRNQFQNPKKKENESTHQTEQVFLIFFNLKKICIFVHVVLY